MATSAAAKGSPSSSTDDSLDHVECDIVERNASGASSGAAKKNLFEDESSSSDEDSEEGGAQLGDGSNGAFKINEAYARRFEHNKKREERQRLEEKYGPVQRNGDGGPEEEEDSESSEDEDEAGFLATEELDAEISATLEAIKKKDPRIYDPTSTFYRPIDEASAPSASDKSKEKPVFLKDYHRERIMKGDVGADFDDQAAGAVPPPQTYAQEQASIKKSIVEEINALAKDGSDEESDSDGEAFIKRKPGQAPVATADGVHPSRAARVKITDRDVAEADKDPELFLSNFMASRAWAPAGDPNWQAFESDDEDVDHNNMAEEFEAAYNMRFEDPEKSNAVLKSYSRTLVADRTVRREEKKGRKKQRELEKERKEAEKQERREERARLRRLKVEETQEKLQKIKQAAGLKGQSLGEEEWATLLDEAWEDGKWEEEMRKRFGEEYYAEDDPGASEDDEDGESSKKSKKHKKPKKPKWDDDIDINDIIPDFDDSLPPNVALSDEEGDEDGDAEAVAEASADEAASSDDDDDDDDEQPAKKRKTSRDHKKDRVAARRTARQERAKIEAIVDRHMELDDPAALAGSSKDGAAASGRLPAFRYRETSPNSFGLTARDILLAPSDAVLNEFVGLKKLATFRDPEKKRKDKKRLGKKARLRQWRRDNFGREFEHTGPTFGFEPDAETAPAAPARERKQASSGGKKTDDGLHGQTNEQSQSRKRKRSKGKKAAT